MRAFAVTCGDSTKKLVIDNEMCDHKTVKEGIITLFDLQEKTFKISYFDGETSAYIDLPEDLPDEAVKLRVAVKACELKQLL